MKSFGPLLLVAAIVVLTSAPARAQMFGQRQLGGMPSRRQTYGAVGNPADSAVNNPGGQITGAERFVRGARQATDFVGSDTSDRRHFVGSRQARSRRTQPVTNLLQARPEPNVNQAAPRSESSPTAGLYPPRLALAPELTGPQPEAVQSAVARHLARSPAIRWTGPWEVSVEGRTAILRGAVATARDRELAEALVQFEPGISDVQNDLQVTSPPSTQAPPAARGFREQAPEIEPAPPVRLPQEF